MRDIEIERTELLSLLDQARRELDATGDPWRASQFLMRSLLRSAPHPDGATQVRTPSRGFYDRLLRRLLTAVRMSVSREELIDELFSTLESYDPGEATGRAQRAADFVILLEGYRAIGRKELLEARIAKIAGGPPGRRQNSIEAFAKRWEESQFVRNLLLEHEGLDFQHSSYAAPSVYDGELRELHGSAPVWLCATPLPATAEGQAERGLVALYSARRDDFDLPRGAAQEWSLLEAVGDIHIMLHHQLSTVAEQVAEERRRILAELAPNAIFHEVGANVALIRDAAKQCAAPLMNIDDKLADNPDVSALIEELLMIRRLATQAQRISEAFNNIEKRNTTSAVPIKLLVDDASIVLSRPLKKNKIKVNTTDVPADLEIRTDAALVQHLIMNVMRNAIEAVGSEGTDRPDRNIWVRARKIDAAETPLVKIDIANDGPRIPPDVQVKMFQRGVTTKPLGHGQGLYICRLIGQHLGGKFEFVEPGEGPETVRFVLIASQDKPIQDDMLSFQRRKKK